MGARSQLGHYFPEMNASHLIIISLLLIASCESKQKPNSMSFLMFVPVTGDFPRIGDGCRAAMNVVINEVNSKMNILPDYHIDPLYQDEGPGAREVSRMSIHFRRNNSAIQSPIFVGPFFSGGCLNAARFVHHIDMVQITIGCSTPQGTARRQSFPNLYRTRSSGELVTFPQLRFIRDVGKWNRFGILSNAANVFDYTVSAFLMTEAVREGFEVSYFDVAPDFDDNVMEALKESDTKIMVVNVGGGPLTLKFLCQSFVFGMTGSRYVFILSAGSYIEPAAMSDNVGIPGCNRAMVYAQLRITYWIGWATATSDDVSSSLVSSIGLKVQDFEAKYLNETKGSIPMDHSKRFLCQDAMLQAVLALDDADRALKSRKMSLKDYQNFPSEVMSVVNQSVAKIDYIGFRIGRLRYSKRLEMDDDIQTVMMWTPETNLIVVSEISVLPDRPLYNYSSYRVRELLKPPWLTRDGKPTRDRSLIVVKVVTTSPGLFWAILAIALAFILFKIGLVGWRLAKKDWLPSMNLHVLPLIGSLCFDTAACCFAAVIPTPDFTSVCISQRVLFVAGLAAFVSHFMVTVYFQIKEKHTILLTSEGLGRFSTNTARFSYTQRNPATSFQTSRLKRTSTLQTISFGLDRVDDFPVIPAPPPPPRSLRLIGKQLLASVSVTTMYLAVWISTEKPNYAEWNLKSKPDYDVDTDSFTFSKVLICTSANELAWIGPIIAVAFLLSGIAIWLSYRLKVRPGTQFNAKVEIETVFIMLVCVVPALIGLILVFVVENSHIDQLTSIAVASLILSAILDISIARLFKKV